MDEARAETDQTKGKNVLGGASGLSEQRTAEERLRSTDPRDYIQVSCFQKKSRAIDNNPNHPWEVIPDLYVWSRDEMGEVCVARVFLQDTRKYGYLVCEKGSDGKESSAFLTEIDTAVGDYLYDTLDIVLRWFPPEAKQKFVQQVVSGAETFKTKKIEEAAIEITSMALNLLDDDPKSVKRIDFPRFPQTRYESRYGPSEATDEQVKQMTEFFTLASSKMPVDEFSSKFNDFINSVPHWDEIYGKNYPYIFKDVLCWVVGSRRDCGTPREQTQNLVSKFPVNQLVKRHISTEEELKEILEKQTIKPEPKTQYMEAASRLVEFVDIDKVVGGPWLKSWADIERSEGAGRSTMKFVKGLSEGTIDIVGRNEPIRVSEVNGEYYILSDGTHRVAALKALGVPFAPMIVTHYQKKHHV